MSEIAANEAYVASLIDGWKKSVDLIAGGNTPDGQALLRELASMNQNVPCPHTRAAASQLSAELAR